MKKIVEYYCELPSAMRPMLWRVWHNVMNLIDKDGTKAFLNYGYASANGEFNDLTLQQRDETDRYGIQLYHHATKGANFGNASVLEVGCGRGGGAAFLARYHKPNVYIALDISSRLVDLCNRIHHVSGLAFICGSATNLPFEADRFDAVVNIESARCYGDMDAFFQEVYRVLIPGGHFYFADMIKSGNVELNEGLLRKHGFDILRQKDIRENVVLALQLDSAARKRTIDERVPNWLRKAFYEFAGVEGSNRFKAFFSSDMQYRSYVLQKHG